MPRGGDAHSSDGPARSQVAHWEEGQLTGGFAKKGDEASPASPVLAAPPGEARKASGSRTGCAGRSTAGAVGVAWWGAQLVRGPTESAQRKEKQENGFFKSLGSGRRGKAGVGQGREGRA